MQRREFLISAGAAALAGALPAAAATRFPAQPITLYCPFTAGGATDQIMRLIGASLGKTLGQPVIIENKSGAGGTLPALTMRTARPDGYTITQVPIAMLRLPHMQKKKTFDPLEDFTFICNVTGYTLGLVVPADSPFKTVQDVISFAKSNPEKITYGSTGVAASPNLLLAEFASLAGIKLTHAPYKGDADMLMAVLGNHVQLGTGTASFAPHVNSGKLRLLATYGNKRSKDWPDVPTLKELGYNVVSESPWGIAGPKGMDPAVVNVLADAIQKSL
jgi:tripartite-type tricarboxylate transporter receptor subunit TctC